jgi:hypothetical protein
MTTRKHNAACSHRCNRCCRQAKRCPWAWRMRACSSPNRDRRAHTWISHDALRGAWARSPRPRPCGENSSNWCHFSRLGAVCSLQVISTCWCFRMSPAHYPPKNRMRTAHPKKKCLGRGSTCAIGWESIGSERGILRGFWPGQFWPEREKPGISCARLIPGE